MTEDEKKRILSGISRLEALVNLETSDPQMNGSEMYYLIYSAYLTMEALKNIVDIYVSSLQSTP